MLCLGFLGLSLVAGCTASGSISSQPDDAGDTLDGEPQAADNPGDARDAADAADGPADDLVRPDENPPNTPPVVEAGPDQSILENSPARLKGTVADDGRPDPPARLTILWTQVSGPGVVTFDDAGRPETDARFSALGTYVLRLTADDSELAAFDETRVTVNPRTTTLTGIQYLGDERAIDWSPGIAAGIPDIPAGPNVLDYGAVGDGQADDTQALNRAIAAADAGTAVYLPPGNYRITSKIRINKGVVVRGAGFDHTILTCDLSSDPCLAIEYDYPPRTYTPLQAGYHKGSSVVTVADIAGFAAGQFVEFRQDNDPALMSGMETDRNVGQFTRVVAVDTEARTLTIEKPLHFSYNPAMNPGARHLTMVEGAGIEDLRIEMPLATGTSYGNVAFIGAANCWMRGVWSHMAYGGHVYMKEAYANEIRGCVFQDTWQRGGGGKGYGIRHDNRSSDNLYTDNIFWKLRHSMILSYGANGNVFSYSYSADPAAGDYADQTQINSGWMYPDSSTHGNYAYMNLFEGNWFQDAVMDNVHGTNAATTLFRNRITRQSAFVDDSAESKFPFVTVAENNDFHNIVANEIGLAGQQAIGYPGRWTTANSGTGSVIIWIDLDAAATARVHGNYEYLNDGVRLSAEHSGWEASLGGENAPIPASLYLGSQPPDWPAGYRWPPFGPENPDGSATIPAKTRFDELRSQGRI
jgi:hypothetical protein